MVKYQHHQLILIRILNMTDDGIAKPVELRANKMLLWAPLLQAAKET